jgi:hypothetical protein
MKGIKVKLTGLDGREWKISIPRKPRAEVILFANRAFVRTGSGYHEQVTAQTNALSDWDESDDLILHCARIVPSLHQDKSPRGEPRTRNNA